jgi:anti-sigma B factor antagonist
VNAAVAVFALPPEVTTERLEEIEPAFAAEASGSERLVVDMGATTFLCSAGLGMLVKASKRLHERGGGLALARPQPGVAKLLRMVGLSSVLPVHPTIEAAASALAGGRGSGT